MKTLSRTNQKIESNLDSLRYEFYEHQNVIDSLLASGSTKIIKSANILSTCLLSEATIFWCGNGGSAADAQHMAAELVGRFKHNRRPLRSLALTTDTSILTCVANDFHYDEIFARQLEALGRLGDVLVVFSTSGQSGNIMRVLKTAKEMGLITIVVPSDTTARIQEAHILIGHIFCELIEQELGFA